MSYALELEFEYGYMKFIEITCGCHNINTDHYYKKVVKLMIAEAFHHSVLLNTVC